MADHKLRCRPIPPLRRATESGQYRRYQVTLYDEINELVNSAECQVMTRLLLPQNFGDIICCYSNGFITRYLKYTSSVLNDLQLALIKQAWMKSWIINWSCYRQNNLIISEVYGIAAACKLPFATKLLAIISVSNIQLQKIKWLPRCWNTRFRRRVYWLCSIASP